MSPTDPVAVARLFLQLRRREPQSDHEITRLVHPHVTYVEVIDGERFPLSGAANVAALMRRFWSDMSHRSRMSVIRHHQREDGRVVGHWQRTEVDRTVVGRDTYTIVDGLIIDILVEEFVGIDAPAPAPAHNVVTDPLVDRGAPTVQTG